MGTIPTFWLLNEALGSYIERTSMSSADTVKWKSKMSRDADEHGDDGLDHINYV